MLRGGWITVMALLVAQAAIGAEPGAVADAAMNDNVAVMRALLKRGANPNARGAFGTPPLHWRVRVDDLDGARMLLKAGADPNGLTERGVSPLSLAIANGNAEMVRLQLKAGADPNHAEPTGETC